MAGLYFHIPFCRKACVYCDFHFSTTLDQRTRVLAAMRRELDLRRSEWTDGPVDNVYFGGGTPSLLTPSELGGLLEDVHRQGTVASTAEITLEANPDDVTPEALATWRTLGINRISLGTQSFRDDRLQWMGRAHDAGQALRSIGLIAQGGFRSWTIDLIYGLPDMTLDEWDQQLSIALDHGMPHLSAYCLTVEPRTALHHQVRQGRVAPSTDADQAAQFEHLTARMVRAGLDPYEISNFAREGHLARHNTSYWKGAPYVGIGPSAHSFEGLVRRWNTAHNLRYATAVEQGNTYSEQETLTTAQRANELLLTGLRTRWGVDLRTLGLELPAESRRAAERHVAEGLLHWADHHLVLTVQGRILADRIASDLFILDA